MKSEESNGKVGMEVGNKKVLVKNTAEIRDSNVRKGLGYTCQEHRQRERKQICFLIVLRVRHKDIVASVVVFARAVMATDGFVYYWMVSVAERRGKVRSE